MSKMFDWEDEEQAAQEYMSEEDADALMEAQEAEPAQDAEAESDDGLFSYEGAEDQPEEAEASTEEEPMSDTELLSDARLRLEQGRLYEMLLKHDMFDGVDADPRAVKNIRLELRTFIRERLEVMLGIRPDPRLKPKQSAQGGESLTQEEVLIIRQLVSKAVQGQRQAPQSLAPTPKAEPKSQSSLSPLKPSAVKVVPRKPAQRPVQPAPKAQVPKQTKNVIEATEDGYLKKNPYAMTPEEKRKAAKLRSAKYVKAEPQNKIPSPDGSQMASHYGSRLANMNPLMQRAAQAVAGGQLATISDVGSADSYDSQEGDSRI